MSKKVLIVDDSRVSRMLVRTMLEDQRPDWALFEVSSGVEAIAFAQREEVDVVTLDVNMPGVSGLAAGERILQLRPDALVAVMTANIQSSVRQRTEALGMHFLKKPITEKNHRTVAGIGKIRMSDLFSPLQHDALCEIFNISVGRAAAAMNGFVGEEVSLSVPIMRMCPLESVGQRVGMNQWRHVDAVCQHFSGSFAGDAFLMFGR